MTTSDGGVFTEKSGASAIEEVEAGILFGSQSGTAEAFAGILNERLSRENVSSSVHGLEHFTPDFFRKFNRYITSRSTPLLSMENVHYTVFGLGDLNYMNYNQMGRRTDSQMHRLGATRIYRRGEGDASRDIEEDFQLWVDGGLVEALRNALRDIEGNRKPSLPPVLECLPTLPDPAITEILPVFSGYVASNKELRQTVTDTLSAREILLSVPEGVTFSTWDSIEIQPLNDEHLLNGDVFKELVDASSLGQWLRKDIVGPLSPSFLESMRALFSFSGDVLQFIDFTETCENYFVNVKLVLQIIQQYFALEWRQALAGLNACKLGTLIESIPDYKFRPYTISTLVVQSMYSSTHQVRIVVSVPSRSIQSLLGAALQQGLLRIADPPHTAESLHVGMCSQYLRSISPNQEITFRIRPSTVMQKVWSSIVNSQSPNVLVVATGSGITAALPVLELSLSNPGVSVTVVFGCRNPHKDYFYKEWLEDQRSDKINIINAFSRDTDSKYKYVQDALVDLDLTTFSHIVVCGSADMSNSVVGILKSLLSPLLFTQMIKNGYIGIEKF